MSHRSVRILRTCRPLLLGAAFIFSSHVAQAEPDPLLATEPYPAGGAPSQPGRAECLEAHQAAQEFKRTGRLLESAERLSVCSASTCPGAIISDCGQWITDLEQTTPSIVFDVRLDGKQAADAILTVDGVAVGDTSKAFKVNPGRHVVRVALPPFEPREETLVLPEGQRMRLVAIEFKSPQPEPQLEASAVPSSPVLAVETSRPTPVIVYPLIGVGVAGLASFGIFSMLGGSKQSTLEKNCEPSCTDAELRSMKTYYLIGDISAGVGAAALIGAAVVYLSRPLEQAPRTGIAFSVGPVTNDLRGFGLSARRTF